MVENALGILVGRLRVLLTTMEQRLEVVKGIVLTCVVLHKMLRSHQVGADRPPIPVDNIQSRKGEMVFHECEMIKRPKYAQISNKLIYANWVDCSNIPHPPLLTPPSVGCRWSVNIQSQQADQAVNGHIENF